MCHNSIASWLQANHLKNRFLSAMQAAVTETHLWSAVAILSSIILPTKPEEKQSMFRSGEQRSIIQELPLW
jgi:hypothetical protein